MSFNYGRNLWFLLKHCYDTNQSVYLLTEANSSLCIIKVIKAIKSKS